MLFPPARRITQRLTNDLARLTESLTPFLPPETGELKSLLTTTKLPIVIPTDIKRERSSPLTTTKLPIVIPADIKRERSSPLPPPSRQHRFIVLPGVLVGSLIVIILASLFVVPLDNGPESNGFGKAVGKWFAGGPLSGVINPSQHIDPPTPTPALRTIDEGYCGGRDIWGVCATAITDSGVMGTGHMQHPLSGAVITQGFGHPEYQAWCGCWKPHNGIDLAAPYGTAIRAADSGQVIWTGWDWSGLGWAVKINHGHYIATIYGHLQRFIVKAGQNVTKGQVIAYEGSTGASTGPHLHFMVMDNNFWVDPQTYVRLP